MHAGVFEPPPAGNTLPELTTNQLWNAQVLLTLGCQRTKLAVRDKQRQYSCYLGRVLKVEADRRGLPSPPSTAGVGDLRKA